MEKKKHRSLEEILNSLKDAENEFDEKLDKYGLKEVKKEKPKEDLEIDQSITDNQEETVSEIEEPNIQEDNQQ